MGIKFLGTGRKSEWAKRKGKIRKLWLDGVDRIQEKEINDNFTEQKKKYKMLSSAERKDDLQG